MARPRKVQPTTETVEPTPAPVPETPAETTGKRRGRRVKVVEPVNETVVMIDVVLRARGAKGATPDILHSVVSWARSIREEGNVINSGRSETSRRQRSEISPERISRHEMNLSLLNGVLSGNIALNVEDNGELVFRHANLVVDTTNEKTPPNEDATATIHP